MLSKMTLHEFLLETDFLEATQLLVSQFFFLFFSFCLVLFLFFIVTHKVKYPTLLKADLSWLFSSVTERSKTLNSGISKTNPAGGYKKQGLNSGSTDQFQLVNSKAIPQLEASKHQNWKQWGCRLCWKLPDRAQSFVFCSQIVTE